MTTTQTPKKRRDGITIAVILIAGFLIIGIVFAVAMNVTGGDDDYVPMTAVERQRFDTALDQGNRTIAETAFEHAFLTGSPDGQDALCLLWEVDAEGSYEYMLTQVDNISRRDLTFEFYDSFLSANC